MSNAIYSGNIGIAVDVKDDVAFLLKKDDILPCHIADYRFEEEGNCTEWHLDLSQGKGDLQIDLEKRAAKASTVNPGVWDVVKIGNLLYERSLQERGQYGLHSSAFEVNGRGVLVLGETMAGKSTVVLEALARYKANLIGAEDSVINSHYELVGGTKLIAPSRQAFDHFHSDLLSQAKSIHRSGRPVFDASSLGVENAHITPVDMVVYPKITLEEQYECVELNQNSSRNLLFRFLGSEIVGLDAIGDMAVPLPSLDTFKLRSERFAVASGLALNTQFYFLAGTPHSIVESILEKLAH